MATREHRNERRQLKQQLFHIRRHVEGERVRLTDEHKQLKKEYEALPNFSNWSDFPDRWDIGDPHSVKEGAWGNELDRRNFMLSFGKPYLHIVHKEENSPELDMTDQMESFNNTGNDSNLV